jgi:hypothetical protein
MVFSAVLERFIEQAPACVMVRATLEQVFAPEKLNAVFETTAVQQYTRELLFATVVDLMSLVVCRVYKSVHAAYVKKQAEVAVSVQALYDKLNHLEPALSRALTRHTACEVGTLLHHMKGRRAALLPGYQVKILDGNHLAGTEHRLGVLRDTNAGALPGLILVVLDPQAMLIADVIPCTDGHAQECTLLEPVLATVQPRDVWIDDRQFCTSDFLFGLARRRAFFITRQHAGHLVWRRCGRQHYVGRGPTGRVFEQAVVLTDPATGEHLQVRRITVKLDQSTRDGDTEIHLLTNLPVEAADALTVAQLYRGRWTLETAFQELTVHLRCEPNTLGYPPAALFAFCVATACYNVLAAVKGAVRAVHGEEKAHKEVSNYFLAEEVSGTYRGMLIAVPPQEWQRFQALSPQALAAVLKAWARRMDLKKYPKHKRGSTKPKRPRQRATRQHVATARLLQKRSHAST